MKLIVLKNHVPINEVSIDTIGAGESYEIFVGRSEDCHVQIDDQLVSRHHFVIRNEDSKWYCDKLSELGVITLNGQLVSHTEIQNGDEIKFGGYSLIISDLPSLKKIEPIQNFYVPKEEKATETIQTQTGTPIVTQTEAMTPVNDLTLESPLEEEQPETTNDELSFSDEASSEEAHSLGEFTNEGSFSENGEEQVGDDNFGLVETSSDDEHESTRVFKAFVNYQLVLFGEHAPYDRFELDQNEIFIGRDPKKCQIILNDPEVSSVHAVVRKNNIDVTLEDLNSSNGTILNGERINKASITAGDEFVIGGTSFTLEVKSDLLDSESDRLMPVESGQVIETEEVHEELTTDAEELDFTSEAPQEKSIIKRIWKNPEQRKKAIYALVGITIAIVMFYEPEPEVAKTETKAAEVKPKETKAQLKLTKELENRRNVAYELGVSFFEQSKYSEALKEFQTVVEIDPNYKNVQTYLAQTKSGLKSLEELEAQRRADEERIKTKKLIEELLVKAREAVKNRQVQVAENYFTQITEKDPENIEVQQLKMELEAWQKDEEKKALELASKEAARKRMIDALSPGKTFYLKKEWYRAILKLEEFLRLKGSDEDLVKEASSMLSDSKNQLASELGPLIGKARSLKEGQDFKNAYEAFLEVLKIEPTNSEALNEVDDIKSQLEGRSKKVYREAIIAESLSLFGDAKEKFQEVQQISPTDSEYYKKASEKLRNYLE